MKGRPACPTPGKVWARDEHGARVAAKRTARDRIAAGEHFDPLYGYRCVCGRWHLTRAQSWDGTPNVPLWSVPDELQAWGRGVTA